MKTRFWTTFHFETFWFGLTDT